MELTARLSTKHHTTPFSTADTDWQRHGRCRDADPSLFFGPEHEAGHERALRETEAKSVCQHCPLLLRCRKHALTHSEQYGIWGGLTESERKRHRRPLWRSRSPRM
ncbi:WhiB family transcriptional regulator [Rhodococcus sp. NPDC003383]